MNFNKLIPELTVSNLKRSRDFYTKTIGFKTEYSREKFAFLSFHGTQIMISENDNWKTGTLERPFGRGINFQIQVKDIKPILNSLKKNNHSLFREPKNNWYRKEKQLLGNREFLVQDPDGYLLRFFQHIGIKSVE